MDDGPPTRVSTKTQNPKPKTQTLNPSGHAIERAMVGTRNPKPSSPKPYTLTPGPQHSNPKPDSVPDMDFDDDFVNLARCDPPNFLCFSLSVYVSVGLSRFLCLSLSLALSLALTSAPVIFATPPCFEMQSPSIGTHTEYLAHRKTPPIRILQ